MPLHLLGKKSWNVYNAANVERVRRDEAEARAKEEAEEQRMQEEDAQRRIARLRGERTSPHETRIEASGAGRIAITSYAEPSQRERRRRRQKGENDTDRDIRYARQKVEANAQSKQVLLRDGERAAPLQDYAGNIQLFPALEDIATRKAEKNAEVEKDNTRKRKSEEEHFAMRFSNAAGSGKSMERPWYATTTETSSTDNNPLLVLSDIYNNKDVWGNEDPLRKEREQNRLVSNDPLATMRRAQKQLKQTEYDRGQWKKRQTRERDATCGREPKPKYRHRHRRKGHDSREVANSDASKPNYGREMEQDRLTHSIPR